MSDRFYVNLPLRMGPLTVEGAEAHHLTAVRRIRPGDRVCLFNGDGHEYAAEVTASGRRKVTLHVSGIEAPNRELGFRLELAAPLPKGDRGQFLLEKLTELGVTTFVPIRTQRSIIHPGEARVEKMRRHVVEACKQCGRNVLMQIAPLVNWDSYCGRSDLPANRFLAHPDMSPPSLGGKGRGFPFRVWPDPDGLALAVGPEGGFTDEEVNKAKGDGWQLVDLGPRTLRLETAAVVLAAWASLSTEPK
jgi:16S rRNA (uracil1498-N3)-methyltransferase